MTSASIGTAAVDMEYFSYYYLAVMSIMGAAIMNRLDIGPEAHMLLGASIRCGNAASRELSVMDGVASQLCIIDAGINFIQLRHDIKHETRTIMLPRENYPELIFALNESSRNAHLEKLQINIATNKSLTPQMFLGHSRILSEPARLRPGTKGHVLPTELHLCTKNNSIQFEYQSGEKRTAKVVIGIPDNNYPKIYFWLAASISHEWSQNSRSEAFRERV